MTPPKITPKLQQRIDELRRLKDQYELTYEVMAEQTGYHHIVLAQWATGAKPLKRSTLRSIRLMLADHAKNKPAGATA